jgi:hypothetical protein
MKGYSAEKRLEDQLFKVRSQYIKRHARSMLRTNYFLKKELAQKIRLVEIYKAKLKKAKKA